jgi:hypothetical protein
MSCFVDPPKSGNIYEEQTLSFSINAPARVDPNMGNLLSFHNASFLNIEAFLMYSLNCKPNRMATYHIYRISTTL